MSNRKNKQEELFPREPATAVLSATAFIAPRLCRLIKQFL